MSRTSAIDMEGDHIQLAITDEGLDTDEAHADKVTTLNSEINLAFDAKEVAENGEMSSSSCQNNNSPTKSLELVHGSGPRAPRAPRAGAVVSFHDINYSVKVKEKGKRIVKHVLKDISGVFKPGMNAILGPTGSGKTSLLDVLAARKDQRGLSGTVLVDGATQPHNFRRISGYVVQDDVVMGTLTIKENLSFSAALRLPSTVTKEERDRRVKEIITELGLTDVANSKVGTEFIRGVSGGERKRTNVGMELITKPSVLFLDEPTTGLDASTANAVLHLLARLSRRGRTIIFSIHQPRFSIFRLFNKMHLLGKGQTIYHGPAQDALQYFSSIGYECEEHNNPPDFFLDVITGEYIIDRSRDEEKDDIETGKSSTAEDVKETTAKLADTFRQSDSRRQMKTEADEIFSNHANGKCRDPNISDVSYPTSFSSQLYHVSGRAVLNIIRNPFLTVIQNVTVIIFAFIIGGIYFNLDASITYGYQNRVGAFFFLLTQVVFENMSAVDIFISEKAIFMHESASGYYRVSVYFLAKVMCDIIPLRLIPSVIYSCITYWMMGLVQTASNFFTYFLTVLLVTFMSSTLCFAVSSAARVASVATIFVTGSYVIMLIFGGLLVNINSLPIWLQWLQYISLFRYGLNALLINEIVGLEFCDGNGTMCVPGTVYLDEQGINHSTWGLWQNELALGVMALGFLVLGYIQLRRIPKLK